MPSRNKNSSAGAKLYGPFQIGEGGHGKQTALDGCHALGAFRHETIGLPLCPIPVEGNDKIPPQYWGDITIVETGLDGPLTLMPGSLGIFYMTTYDNFSDYALIADKGVIWREGKLVYFRAPSEPGDVTISVDGRQYTITVLGTVLLKPSIVSPDNHYEGSVANISFQSSDPVVLGSPGFNVHHSTDWEMSTDPDFNTLYRHSYRSTELQAWDVFGLNQDQDYYVRVRYNFADGIAKPSLWSNTLHFSTKTPKTVLKPSITNPVNQQFAVPQPMTITATGFSVTGYGDTPEEAIFLEHASSDWVIATNANFSDIVAVMTQSSDNKTTWTPDGLQSMVLYYVKVRYRNIEFTSLWSDAVSFVLGDSVPVIPQ